MSVAPLTISYFGSLFFLSSNTDFPVKSLIAIIWCVCCFFFVGVLVVQEFNFIVQQ